MNLAVFNPQPFQNEYASRMFLQPLLAYAQHRGVPFKSIDRLVPEHGWSVVANADYLTPEVVRHFKENDCPIYGISCIDSSYPSETLRGPHLADVTKLFMVSGVQNTNTSHATVIDPDFTIRSESRQFLPEDEWAVFDYMRRAGRILSLPYVPWRPFPEVPHVPFAQKRPTILFRGGNHLLRFVAYLMALRNGCADQRCGFQTRAYFADDMNPQFRYCDSCRAAFKGNVNSYPYGQEYRPGECQSAAPWGEELDMSVPGRWNNRCPQSFYWLSEQFAKRHGEVDMYAIARALNFHTESDEAHMQAISQVRFYAECKWEFSIHMAQRFWQAASVGTVNLLPIRAEDQDYFPVITKGDHYAVFANDLQRLGADFSRDNPSEPRYLEHQRLNEHIGHNTHELYEQWIKPTQFAIGTKLLQHILNQITP